MSRTNYLRDDRAGPRSGLKMEIPTISDFREARVFDHLLMYLGSRDWFHRILRVLKCGFFVQTRAEDNRDAITWCDQPGRCII